jgi:hypothetical protein
MSRSVHERLRELETDVRDLEVLPAAAVRARGRSRGRRQMAGLTAAAAVVAITAGFTLGWTGPRTTPAGDAASSTGITSSPGISCVLALPASPAEVRVRVLEGGARAGVRGTTAAQLTAREFTVLDGATGRSPEDATALRYGPAAIGAAILLRATLVGEVAMRFDPERRDDTIDLTVGPTFKRLATATEVNQILVVVKPSPPAECSTTR